MAKIAELTALVKMELAWSAGAIKTLESLMEMMVEADADHLTLSEVTELYNLTKAEYPNAAALVKPTNGDSEK